MKKDKVARFNRIYEVSSFQKSFLSAVNEGKPIFLPKGKYPTEKYKTWLELRLVMLDTHGVNALRSPNFELLSTGKPPKIYSIRCTTEKKNLRVLYTIDGEDIILLTAFIENSRADYKLAIEKAKNILKNCK